MNIDTIDRRIDALIDLTDRLYAAADPETTEARMLYAWHVQSLDEQDPHARALLFDRVSRAIGEQIADSDGDYLRSLFAKICDQRVPTSAVPLCTPRPCVVFHRRLFAFSGICEAGTREHCFALTEKIGGRCTNRVTKALHYLVIGKDSPPGWKGAGFGKKITTAMRYRESGSLAIISEVHWMASLSWASKSLPIVRRPAGESAA